MDPATTTQLLVTATGGDAGAAARLTPLIYEEMKMIAVHHMRPGSGPDLTLQPTALVHEAFLKLVDQKAVDEASTSHFRALAAVAVRHALVEHIRRRKRLKRGGDRQRVTLAAAEFDQWEDGVDAQSLDDALNELAKRDARAAKIIELRFFGGLTEMEVAAALGVSERTVRNDWAMARAWLQCRLDDS